MPIWILWHRTIWHESDIDLGYLPRTSLAANQQSIYGRRKEYLNDLAKGARDCDLEVLDVRRVLIVVDMQNDFVVEEGALSSPAARMIVPFVRERVQSALQSGDEVVFTLDTHDQDDAEFAKFEPHCLRDSWGGQLISELKELLGEQVGDQVHFVEKNRYSAFYQTDLEEYLGLAPGSQRLPVDEVELVGVCTNICCYFTAEELANRDVPVKVYARGVASFDAEAHTFALGQMRSVLGVDVV